MSQFQFNKNLPPFWHKFFLPEIGVKFVTLRRSDRGLLKENCDNMSG